MELLDFILEIDPAFEEVMKTPQYAHSSNIINFRIKGRHSLACMTRFLGVEEELYAKMEACDMTVPLEVYEKMAKRIQEEEGTWGKSAIGCFGSSKRCLD